MGIFLTVLYIMAAYLSPTLVFGTLAEYRLQLVIAGFALVASLFALPGSGIARLPQSVAMLGLTASVFLSMIANGLLGLSGPTLLIFIPNAIVFFFIIINFRTKRSLQLLIAALFFVATFIIVQGAVATQTGDATSPWVLIMHGSAGAFYRIRGLDLLNDPNDLAQFIVGLIPCMFFFWRKGRAFGNLLLVYAPVMLLLYGMFLTHSRGGMLALLAASLIAARRKIGTAPAAITAAVLFVALSAVGWSGGRDVSADSGQDRMEAWSTGMELIRSHPVFGVGFQRFTEFYYITAHNTVVVTAAELGILGLFFWTLMVASTVRDVASAASLGRRVDAKTPESDAPPWQTMGAALMPSSPMASSRIPSDPVPQSGFTPRAAPVYGYRNPEPTRDAETVIENAPRMPGFGMDREPELNSGVPDDELRRLCGLMVISFTGFLTAGWFLSRSYTMVLYVNVGIAVATYNMARLRGAAPAPLPIGRAMRIAGGLAVLLVAMVYAMLRLDHLLPK
jgi:O-antigen ligase